MKNKNDILVYLYTNRVVERYGHKLLEQFSNIYVEDVIAEVYARICEIDESKLLEMERSDDVKHQRLLAFIRGVVIRSLISKTGIGAMDLKKRIDITINERNDEESTYLD